MKKQVGSQTVCLENPVVILSAASIVGKKEGEGPLGTYFDEVLEDDLNNEDSWEKAESSIVKKSFECAVKKSKTSYEEISYILAGDLLNQNTSSTFGVKGMNIPFFGVFGACSTMGEAMGLSSMIIDGGFADCVLAGAGSHFCSAEKQFRFPLDLGTQRAPTASWTVTGHGSVLLSKCGAGPVVTHITAGKVVDFGVNDTMNMGAAMAPAAASVISAHFEDTKRDPDYYDVIATGDLGYVGAEILKEILKKEDIVLGSNYTDCGIEIFDKEKQDTHSGGSGCACSAVTFCGYFYKKLLTGGVRNILFVPTGALMSPTSSQQGESIPGIAHALAVEGRL